MIACGLQRWGRWTAVAAALLWLTGCASDEPAPPAEDKRARIDQILSPQGAKPNAAYTKRSRYDGQDFRSRTLGKKSWAGAGSDGRAREGNQDFRKAGGLKARWSGQTSRFQDDGAREADQKAHTFASRFDNQEARTQPFSGADERYRTEPARETSESFHTGQPRRYSTRTLGAPQLSPTASETANFSLDKMSPLNVEDVRRVLNKPPR